MTNIVKATSKGQVTLPAKWRKNFDTDRFLIKTKGDSLIITPLNIDELEEDGEWTTIFDADRDNDGKGVPIDEFIKAIKNTL
ncbi:AbrB/MazE/SpoVT family DNA-binding domain-containing protein [Patescibacteria group bacterium]